MKTYRAQKLIREGDLVAEVEIELHNDDTAWGPTMSREDAFKLDDVRKALREKDYKTVESLARLYRLTPVHAA